mmetsp:Transcript_17774/g.41399  ORF Transcript_17774/g.41399 Transcript_17774/m.41399 type:complete len:395 (+) Transcript_17774:35-1219(+)
MGSSIASKSVVDGISHAVEEFQIDSSPHGSAVSSRTGGPQIPTSFHKCPFLLPRGFRDSSGLACRSDEEESCNEVRATCAYAPRTALQDLGYAMTVGPPCGIRGQDGCNARAIGYPWGLDNPEASKWLTKGINGSYHEEVHKEVNVPAPWTIWGMAVHGKSGTWAFDSGGRHAEDYVYQVPQGGYAPSDYYICDSREKPQHCGLLGGNLARGCAEYYDPISCPYCEDNGTTLTCQVRGWDPRSGSWAKVPIYPRDLLGELYRGEWRDLYAKPVWASVTLRKAGLQNVKKLPKGLIAKGPSKWVATLKYADATEAPGGFAWNLLLSASKLLGKGVSKGVAAAFLGYPGEHEDTLDAHHISTAVQEATMRPQCKYPSPHEGWIPPVLSRPIGTNFL